MGSTQVTTQAVVVSQATPNKAQLMEEIAFFDADGTPRLVPDRAVAVADLGALTSATITGGEPPTEAEFNALRVDVAANRTKINALLAALRNSGSIAT